VPGELALEDEGDDVEGEEEPQDNDVDNSSTVGKKGKKKRDASTLRKAPQAPKRFKSSYICFFMAMQPKIKEELGDKATVTEISKRSAQMWRTLPQEDRAHWDDVAAKDKQRFLVEKAAYTGPWQVPWKRAKKDPSAPKRPMSAFLYFSQGKRRQIKEANPSMKNTEVSRLLGEMWRNAPESEKMPHIEKEKGEREKYKVAIADWRKDFDARIEKERKAQAEQAAYMANMYPPNSETQHQQYPPPPYDPNMYPGQQPNMGPPPPSAPGYGYGAPPPSYPPYGKSRTMSRRFYSRFQSSSTFPNLIALFFNVATLLTLLSLAKPIPVSNQRETTCDPWA